MTNDEKVTVARLEESVKDMGVHMLEIKTTVKQNAADIRDMRLSLAEVQGARAALKFMFRGLLAIASVAATWVGLDIWGAK